MEKHLRKILTYSPASLGRVQRFWLFQIKMWLHCARLLRMNRAGQQAAALAYHSIFGLVPLIIVMLLAFQSLPNYSDVSLKLRLTAYEQLSLTEIRVPIKQAQGDDETVLLTTYIDDMIEKFLANLDTGSIGIVGAILVIWAALGLLTTTERAFNHIWHVAKGRSWVSRILNYWSLLTLGPLLLGVAIHLLSRHALVTQLENFFWPQFWPVLISYIAAVLGFFLLYYMLPNAQVHAKSALWGAMVAAVVWSLARWGFGLYVTQFIPYSKIYGVIGLIPLTVFWLHATWLIALFGLQLTYTTQHLHTLDAAAMQAERDRKDHFIANDLTVIQLLRTVAQSFATQQSPLTSAEIFRRLDIPTVLGQKILDHLTESALLVRTCEPVEGYMPACEPEQVTLAAISSVVARVSFCQYAGDNPSLNTLLDAQRLQLTEINLKQLLDSELPSVAQETDNLTR